MKKLSPPFNEDVMYCLNEFIEWWDTVDSSVLKLKGEPDEDERCTSREYYEEIDWDTHIGYPTDSWGIDMMETLVTPKEWRAPIMKVNRDLNNLLSAKQNAIMMYYPPNGYIGWHDNRNCAGYNILLTYSKGGKGWFRYAEGDEFVTIDDDPGWNVKYGYYGDRTEKEKQCRHCARTYEDRLTFGFVVPDENLWKMAIEDLCE